MSGAVADRLRGAGPVEGSGKIAVDSARAREKLCRFRLANPYLYVLQFVSAASIAGASKIEFRIDADEMECVFDVAIPRRLIGELWTRAYGHRTEPLDHVAYQLALGLGSGQALNPREIVLETSAHDGATLRLTPKFEERILGCSDFGEGTRIYLREKFKFGHLAEFFMARQGKLAEIEALEEMCSVSWLDVWVNGERVSFGADSELEESRHRFESVYGRGEFELTTWNRFELRLLKHDVLLGRWAGRAQGFGVVGRVASPHFRTDLTSFGLVRDEQFSRLVNQLVHGEYHDAIADRLEAGTAHRPSLFAVAASVYDRVDGLVAGGIPVPEGTQRLARVLVDHPMWPRADAPGEWASFSEIVKCGGGVFRHANARVETSGSGLQGVAFLPEVVDELDDMPSAATMRRARDAMSRWMAVDTLDLSRALRIAELRQRNRALWESRPVAAPPQAPYMAEVVHEGLRGWVWLSPGADDPATVDLRREGKTIAEQEALTCFSVVLDGNLPTNETFSGAHFNSDVRQLITSLARRLPDLFSAYAEDVLAGDAALDRSMVSRWLRRCLAGTVVPQFCAQFGLAPDRADRNISMSDWPAMVRLDDLRVSGRPADLSAVLHALGPLADLPLFTVSDRSTDASLRELAAAERLTFVRPSSGDETLRHTERFEEFEIVVADDEVRSILEALFDVRPLRAAVRALELEREFMAKPTFDGPAAGTVLHRLRDETSWCEFDVVLSNRLESGCDVYYVHRDRLLSRTRFELPIGRIHVVVRGDCVEPDDDWSGVAPGMDTDRVLQHVELLCNRVVRQWIHACAADANVPDEVVARTKYFELCARLFDAGEERELVALPVVRVVDGELRREMRSYYWLRDRLVRAQKCLPVVRTGDLNPEELAKAPAPALDLGRAPIGLAKELFAGCRILNVSVGAAQRETARRDFLRRPREEFGLSSELVVAEVQHGGVRARVAWIPSRLRAERPLVAVRVMYESRFLESLTVRVPFGHFQAFVWGPGIEPDPTYTFVGTGREAVLRVVLHGAAAAIREGCRKFIATGTDPQPLDRLRPELWKLVAWLRQNELSGPFGELRDQLDEPLIQTTSGRWITLANLDRLAVRGRVLPYATEGSSERVLFVTSAELPHAREALPDFAIEPAAVTGVRLWERPVPQDAEPLLQDLSRQLLAARGDRSDLLEDYLARRIEWASDGDETLCRVDREGIFVSRKHPLVTEVIRAGIDRAALAFLSSVVYSEVNRHYQMITDHDELDFQRRFLRLMRR